jgi:hypothetical protein
MPAIDSTVAHTELSPIGSNELANAHSLPSGRSVVVKVDGGREELEIRSPSGEMEVRITLTESGPVVNLRGARLEMEATDAVALRCRRFEVQSTEGTELTSSGDVQITGRELKVRTERDIHMKGEVIRLNC